MISILAVFLRFETHLHKILIIWKNFTELQMIDNPGSKHPGNHLEDIISTNNIVLEKTLNDMFFFKICVVGKPIDI